MSEVSARLSMPYIMPSQAQKHVTHNEALQRLDALVQLSVISRAVMDPPGGATEGDSFVVPVGATGAWVDQTDALAVWQAGAWMIIAPGAGWVAYVQDEAQLVRYLGGWESLSQPQSTAFLGINGTADTANRFVCQSTGVLFNHDGTHARTTINKASVDDDASHNYQTGFSSRALVGLLGSDDYTVKVSDGSSFVDALVVDHTSGEVALPRGIRLGGTSAQNVMRDFQSGTWAPTLGTTLTGDLVGATGLTVIYASYVKVGNLVTANFGFELTGLSATAFTQKSSLTLENLPFDSNVSGQGGVSGMVWDSGSPTQATALGGVIAAPATLHLSVLAGGGSEAQLSDRFHVSLSYMSDD